MISDTSRIVRFARVFFLPVAFAVVFATPTFAQFEGVVESQNLTTGDEGNLLKFTITMWIKNDRMRVETGPIGTTPATTMIYRRDRKIVWMLNDEERSFFEILQNDTGLPGDTVARATPSGESLIKTGKKKKLLGYPCDLFVIRNHDQVTELWGTRSLAGLMETTSRVLGIETDEDVPSWNRELRRLGMYTLSVRTKVGGKVVEAQDISKIEQRTVDEERFELPEGYKKQVIGGN